MSHLEVPGALAGRKSLAIALAALVLAFQPHGRAIAAEKSAEAKAVETTVRSAATELEEVIVSGKLDKLSEVQKAMVEAEDRFWSRHNELNKNPYYDVTCLNEAETGTRLKTRQCEAEYLRDAKRQDALRLFIGYHEANIHLETEGSLAFAQQDELKRRVLANTLTDPELLHALIQRFLLQDRYDQLRKKKFDGHVVVWD